MKSILFLFLVYASIEICIAAAGVSAADRARIEAWLKTGAGGSKDPNRSGFKNNKPIHPDPDLSETKELDPTDFMNAQQLPQLEGDGIVVGGDDPMLKSGKFEGDIDLRGLPIEAYVDTYERGNKDLAADVQSNAVRGQYYRWPNNEIPFVISNQFGQYERSIIASAIEEYNAKTCIRWKPRTNQRDYVYMVKKGGCYSSVGKVGNWQELSLGSGCVQKGVVVHEMMHAVGFYHEQSRTDRDSYVNVYWQNIQPWAYYNFDKYGVDKIDDLGTSYDYDSIMHYGKTAFTKAWGQVTILPKDGRTPIGQRRGLSTNDAKKINLLYKCPNTGGGGGGEEKSGETGKGGGGGGGTGGNCFNYNAFCDSWSTRGQCTSNPAYMLRYCPKACGTCKTTACSNSGEHCGYWKRNGYCKSYKEYMSAYCKNSCGLC